MWRKMQMSVHVFSIVEPSSGLVSAVVTREVGA